MIKYIKNPLTENSKEFQEELSIKVKDIINIVKEKKDKGVIEIEKLYDKWDRKSLKVSQEEIKEALNQTPKEILDAIENAIKNVKKFHAAQKKMFKEIVIEGSHKEILGIKFVPVERVGVYVPGGKYPLPSSAIMGIIPAVVAGVKEIAACSPPVDGKRINPVTLAAIHLCGVNEIYCMGGAQAIAAFALGTESVKPVNLIVGPGNIYVTEAKRQLFGKVGIDLIAGPSEVLIIADESANPKFIAADILAQCEHDINAKAYLISLYDHLVDQVEKEIKQLLNNLSTKETAKASWEKNGTIILVDNIEEAVKLTNKIAPEHLEIMTKNPEEIFEKVTNYGSCFLGNYSAESFGDYISGTNHILPTSNTAKFTGGVWVGTYIKALTFQKLTKESIKEKFAKPGLILSEIEGLKAHKLSMELRLKEDD